MNQCSEREENPIAYYQRVNAARNAPRANTERRLALIVAERGISDKELEQFRGSRRNSKVFKYPAFCKKYQISLEWLLDGDLKGLREMAQRCPSQPEENSTVEKRELLELAKSLNDEQRARFVRYLRRLATEETS
jgi:hypothetical protein